MINMEYDLMELGVKYAQINNEKKQIEAQLKALKEKIITIMKIRDLKNVRNAKYSVSYSVVKPNKRADTRKLKTGLILLGKEDLWDRCLIQPRSFERLQVTELKEECK